MPGVVEASTPRSTSSASGMRAGVDLQDLAPPVAVRGRDADAAVEPTRAQQRRVEDLGAVGGAQDDDGLVAVEAVHLGEDLVQRLLALVVGAGDPRRSLAGAPDRVKLVDEDDRRRGLLGLGEQVADAGGADADDRLDELRRGDREERRVRLAGHRAGQQRLAGAGRPEQQHAMGHPPAQLLVALGGLEEVDDLGQLGLGLVDAGHVVKRDPDLLGVDAARLGAPEVAQPAQAARAAGLRAAGEQHEQPDQQQRRPEPEQDLGQHRRVLRGGLGVDLTPWLCSRLLS